MMWILMDIHLKNSQVSHERPSSFNMLLSAQGSYDKHWT